MPFSNFSKSHSNVAGTEGDYKRGNLTFTRSRVKLSRELQKLADKIEVAQERLANPDTPPEIAAALRDHISSDSERFKELQAVYDRTIECRNGIIAGTGPITLVEAG